MKKTKISPKIELLFQEKESIKTKIADKENLEDIEAVAELNDKLNKVTDKIANICAEKNKALVNEYLCGNNDVIEGYSQPKTWNLKKRLSPKNTSGSHHWIWFLNPSIGFLKHACRDCNYSHVWSG